MTLLITAFLDGRVDTFRGRNATVFAAVSYVILANSDGLSRRRSLVDDGTRLSRPPQYSS